MHPLKESAIVETINKNIVIQKAEGHVYGECRVVRERNDQNGQHLQKHRNGT